MLVTPSQARKFTLLAQCFLGAIFRVFFLRVLEILTRIPVASHA
jgi:hypothetical protein